MGDKTELIQFRVDAELKKRFYELAEKNGESPSNHLRSLMRQALENETGKITNLVESKKSTTTILLEILSYIQRRALLHDNDAQWTLYEESFLPEYLEETIDEAIRDAGLTGDNYWQRHWEEIDKNWFTKFKENPPILADYLRRDFMRELRTQIRKQTTGNDPNHPKQRKRTE